jgi:hypothetical protein
MGDLGFSRGERVELIQGSVVRLSPIRPSHASVVDRLAELLLPRLVGRARVRIQQDGTPEAALRTREDARGARAA